MTHGLGYLHAHPLELASRASASRWPMSLLLSALPPVASVPASYRCPDTGTTALDQDGIGACVAFAAVGVKQAEDHADWGRYLYASGTWTGSSSSTGAYLAYWWLKHGHGAWPGDGIPTVEGSYPEAAWRMALSVGVPDATGAEHTISAYYSQTVATDADDLLVQQAIVAAGPVNIAIPWPNSWMRGPAAPDWRMPFATDFAGGHSFAVVGWETYADGLWWTCVNSWGPGWTDPAGTFRIKASWLHAAPFGPQVAWKPVDLPDAPTPPAPEDAVITAAPDTAATPWDVLLDLRAGCAITASDGRAVPLRSGGAGVWSPFATDTTRRAVRFSSGGIAQLGTVALADCSNMRPRADPGADYDAGLDAAAAAVAAVPRK